MVLEIPFLTFSNSNVLFSEQEFIWKSYTAVKALLTTKRMESIDKKKFAKTIFDEQSKTFVIHIAALKAPLLGMTIHPSQVAPIFNGNSMQVAALK